MGSIQTIHLDQYEAKQFLPTKVLKPFSYGPNPKAPGTLVLEFKGLPPIKGRHVPDFDSFGDTTLWWSDCQFMPCDDSSFLTSVTAFQPRPMRTPTIVSSTVTGLTAQWTLENDRLKCEVIKNSNTKSYPKVSLHPSGNFLTYISQGKVNLTNITTLKSVSKLPDIGKTENFRFLAMSPNGMFIATIAKIRSTKFELSVLIQNRMLSLQTTDSVVCNTLCAGFEGSRLYTEEAECKWSPDSAYIAVSASFGKMFVVKRKDLNLHFNLNQFDLNRSQLSNARALDFDPRYCHSHLAWGISDNTLFVCNIDTSEVLLDIPVHCDDLLATIDCVSYNKSGTALAVALSNACIQMYHPDNGDKLYVIDGRRQGSLKTLNPVIHQYPNVIRLSFSQAGDHLVTCSTDGRNRVWQLQPDLSLQHLCRVAIIKHVPADKFSSLPLPSKLVLYLLFYPTSD